MQHLQLQNDDDLLSLGQVAHVADHLDDAQIGQFTQSKENLNLGLLDYLKKT
jgi:hypothetical protein